MPHWLISAIAGAFGAAIVLAVAMVGDLAGHFASIPRSELPAWVQAFGSIAAIAASSAFAIWVPLHMRSLADRGIAQRALSNCVVVSELVAASWANLRGVVERGEFHAQTPDLVVAEGDAIRAIVSQIPISVLSRDAVNSLHVSRTWIYGVTAVAKRLAAAEDPAQLATEIDFAKTAKMVTGPSEAFALMKAVKIKGHWIVCDPTEAAE